MDFSIHSYFTLEYYFRKSTTTLFTQNNYEDGGINFPLEFIIITATITTIITVKAIFFNLITHNY